MSQSTELPECDVDAGYDLHLFWENFRVEPGWGMPGWISKGWSYVLMYHGHNVETNDALGHGPHITDGDPDEAKDHAHLWMEMDRGLDPDDIVETLIHRGDYTPVQVVTR